MKKRALLSVSDKNGILEFAKALEALDYEILSTGGTMKHLKENGVAVTAVDEVTGFPEIMEGRVKTLNPMIHGGLLAKQDDPAHQAQMTEHGIQPIHIVCVNLYPFKETISKPEVSVNDAIENIDIGGPAMLRASAKNHAYVTVIVDASDYGQVLEELQTEGQTTHSTRRRLAAKVFRHTAGYDAMIAGYLTNLAGEELPESVTFTIRLKQPLRYGENPHQKAAFYNRRWVRTFQLPMLCNFMGKSFPITIFRMLMQPSKS